MMLMTRFLILSLVLIFLVPSLVLADEGNIDSIEETETLEIIAPKAPIMTFRQQVDCVTTIRQHPAILQATIDQSDNVIEGSLVIRNSQNRAKAKEYAVDFIRLIKRKSLDENPDKDEIGKGLYTYKIKVTRADKTSLATGIKRFDDTKITWAIDDEGNKDPSMSADESLQ